MNEKEKVCGEKTQDEKTQDEKPKTVWSAAKQRAKDIEGIQKIGESCDEYDDWRRRLT